MTITKSTVASAIGLALAGASLSAQANLTTTAVLSFGSTSYFAAQLSPTFGYTTSITSFQGIKIGILQPASGSHTGAPNGTESPSVDVPEAFFYNTGMLQIIGVPVTLLSHSATTATLDFRGWNWNWNGYPNIPLYDPGQGDTGIATLTCSTPSCSNTSSYILDYAGHVPLDNPSGWGGVQFVTHLEGQISSAVPVPAAVWLFGSGLAGLAAAAKRRKTKLPTEQ